MLPKDTLLGNLKIIEIYEFYNIPVLFACMNSAGHIYLAVWIDETEEKDTWLYVSLSPHRFAQLRAGKVDLYNAYAKAEDDIVLETIVYKNSIYPSKINPISIKDLNKNWLPQPNDYLDVPNSLPQVIWENVDQRDTQHLKQIVTIETVEPDLVKRLRSQYAIVLL